MHARRTLANDRRRFRYHINLDTVQTNLVIFRTDSDQAKIAAALGIVVCLSNMGAPGIRMVALRNYGLAYRSRNQGFAAGRLPMYKALAGKRVVLGVTGSIYQRTRQLISPAEAGAVERRCA